MGPQARFLSGTLAIALLAGGFSWSGTASHMNTGDVGPIGTLCSPPAEALCTDLPHRTPGPDEFFADFRFKNALHDPLPSALGTGDGTLGIDSPHPVTVWSPTNGDFMVDVSLYDGSGNPVDLGTSPKLFFQGIALDVQDPPEAPDAHTAFDTGISSIVNANTARFVVDGASVFFASSTLPVAAWTIRYEDVDGADTRASWFNAVAKGAFHCQTGGPLADLSCPALGDSLDAAPTPVVAALAHAISGTITVADGVQTGSTTTFSVSASRTRSLLDDLPPGAVDPSCYDTDFTWELVYLGESPPQDGVGVVNVEVASTVLGSASLGLVAAAVGGATSISPDNNGYYRIDVTADADPGAGCAVPIAALLAGSTESITSQVFHAASSPSSSSGGTPTLTIVVGDTSGVLGSVTIGQSQSPPNPNDLNLDPGNVVGIQFDVTDGNGLADVDKIVVQLFALAADVSGAISGSAIVTAPDVNALHISGTGVATAIPGASITIQPSGAIEIIDLDDIANDPPFKTRTTLRLEFTLPNVLKDLKHVPDAVGGTPPAGGHAHNADGVTDGYHIEVFQVDADAASFDCSFTAAEPTNTVACRTVGFNVNNIAPEVTVFDITPNAVLPSAGSSTLSRTVAPTVTIQDDNYQNGFLEFAAVTLRLVDPNTGAVVTTQSVGAANPTWTNTDQSHTPVKAATADGTRTVSFLSVVVPELAAFGLYPIRVEATDDGLQLHTTSVGSLSDLDLEMLSVDGWLSVSNGFSAGSSFAFAAQSGSTCSGSIFPSSSSSTPTKACTTNNFLVENNGNAPVSFLVLEVPNTLTCTGCGSGTFNQIPLTDAGEAALGLPPTWCNQTCFGVNAFRTGASTELIGATVSVDGGVTSLRIGNPLSTDGVLLHPGETLEIQVKDLLVTPGTAQGSYGGTFTAEVFFRE